MKRDKLLDCIGHVDDQLIEKAADYTWKENRRKHPLWLYKSAAIAASLVLVIFGAVAVINGGNETEISTADTQAAKTCQVLVTKEYAADEQANNSTVQVVSSRQSAVLSTGNEQADGETGKDISAHVAPESTEENNAEVMSLDEAKEYAYLDYESATEEMKEKILEARNVIIFSSDWVADGYSGSIQNVETGEIVKELPAFSELFPGWDMPVYPETAEQITEDGLGTDCLYGMPFEILQINTTNIVCRSAESVNMLDEGQIITIYLPDSNTPESLELKEGNLIFVSYYGKNCSIADGTIYAESINRK